MSGTPGTALPHNNALSFLISPVSDTIFTSSCRAVASAPPWGQWRGLCWHCPLPAARLPTCSPHLEGSCNCVPGTQSLWVVDFYRLHCTASTEPREGGDLPKVTQQVGGGQEELEPQCPLPFFHPVVQGSPVLCPQGPGINEARETGSV